MSGKIYLSYHKPFPMLSEQFLVPVHAGRKGKLLTKDGLLSSQDKALLMNLPGDDTGENISDKNREYSECTVLYWVWKNADYQKDTFVGLHQYRRQFILNDFFENAENNKEKVVYQCVHVDANQPDISKMIGLTEEAVEELMKEYDVILPNSVDLTQMNTMNIYEDWCENIPGVHIGDLIRLEEYFTKQFPEEAEAFVTYLNSGTKLMYQMLIARPQVFADYCQWLFSILFEMEKTMDVSFYSTNGRRTMGYLAEVLYGFYFTKSQVAKSLRCKTCGVTFLEPGEQSE